MYSSTKDDNMQNMKNTATSAVSDAKDDLKKTVNKASTKVVDIYNTACDEVTHAKEAVTTQIRTNPVQSSIFALGIGFVLGALFRR